MSSEPQRTEPALMSGGADEASDNIYDDMLELGYEAAHPCLQEPLWRDTLLLRRALG